MHLLYTMQINSYRRINVKVVGAGRSISALQRKDNTKKTATFAFNSSLRFSSLCFFLRVALSQGLLLCFFFSLMRVCVSVIRF